MEDAGPESSWVTPAHVEEEEEEEDEDITESIDLCSGPRVPDESTSQTQQRKKAPHLFEAQREWRLLLFECRFAEPTFKQ